MDQQYDFIVIGTGETGKSTVQTLNEQGQQVMFIELSPEMLTTMVCHYPKKNPPSSQGFEADKDHEQMKTKIHLQKQSIHTPAGETITYTFHVEEVKEKFKYEGQKEDEQHGELQNESNNHPYEVWEDEEQPIKLNFADDIINSDVETIDSELIDEDINLYEERNEPAIEDVEHYVYEFEDLQNDFQIEEMTHMEQEQEEEEEEEQEQQEQEIDQEENIDELINDLNDGFINQNENQLNLLSHTLKPSTLSQQKEKENAFREKLIRQKEKMDSYDLFKDQQDTEKKFFEQKPEPISSIDQDQEKIVDDSSFLHSVLNKPSYSPRESRLRKRLSYKPKHQTEITKPIPVDQMNTDSQPSLTGQMNHPPLSEQKVYSFEPFSSRRRARAQKKNRILTTVERLNTTHSDIEESSTISNAQDNIDDLHITPKPNPSPKTNLENQSVPESLDYEEEFDMDGIYETNESNLSNDLLKKDDIEIEEPYGGYNSWEDFLTPYSQNNRKRQEIDEIEKRKIALRGLHNLINNLG